GDRPDTHGGEPNVNASPKPNGFLSPPLLHGHKQRQTAEQGEEENDRTMEHQSRSVEWDHAGLRFLHSAAAYTGTTAANTVSEAALPGGLRFCQRQSSRRFYAFFNAAKRRRV